MKRLDRLAPNLVHMCIFIWEWVYAKQIVPRYTRGHLGGFRGLNIPKVRGSCQTAGQIGTNFGSHLRIHLGMDMQVAPQYPRGHLGGGGFRESQIKMYGEAVKRLDRLAPHLLHVCGFVLE